MLLKALAQIAIRALAIFLVVGMFEFLKASFSYKFGDTSPQVKERLTLNPLKHFEPIGFIIFLVYGYGWGDPVKTSSVHYKDKKKMTIITYVAPMIICVLLGMIFVVLSSLVGMLQFNTNVIEYLSIFCSELATAFVAIAVFNIVPIYPLSGNKVIVYFMKPNQVARFIQYEKIYQMAVVMMLLLHILQLILLNPLSNLFLAIPRLLPWI